MRFGMIIDLNLCSSCGACALACKAENNTRTRGEGQSFNWADFIQETRGVFPNTTQIAIPVHVQPLRKSAVRKSLSDRCHVCQS